MKIGLLGYGKMGQTIEKSAKERKHEIVYIADKNMEEGDLEQADIAINFSVPDAAVFNIKKALQLNIPVVCGTTGWLDKFEEITRFCEEKNTAFLYASNFSIGVNLFFKLNALAASLIEPHKQEYKVSMKEIHHVHKLDAPSGTALSLAKPLLSNDYFKEWELNGTGLEKLNIESIREGEIPGKHIVTFRSGVDKISLKHEAFNRDGFAQGAIIAAEWLVDKKGIFTMQDVLNIS
ncbi:4-hydroxy-tetrahydrodipicolinate reductase [Flavobacteriaceae bacterium]|jgi:4-hydroxy-tetrahydrodipicolinate reductase|nr:4-hydroxy-tetrahydrodipicolinate reductase [Flavobacteriaceae bacterium]MDB4062995.1 4-hydroxy-tetrahydrodipicolinate reductase [Flavobacteriaceae bacterium]MDC0001206.1 4-hydroxy-tetrahydrodipicolinate reductase [Flavobacteriaceae bacterium]MDC1392288.1 4-hydroxy-tetrahydrodipicolinate reductase [Flavobacteriaceae bacterium]|tara:strand:+ start:468 stop:1172 length:705 start_codon:yes stop_codon:yes gene_type:complete